MQTSMENQNKDLIERSSWDFMGYTGIYHQSWIYTFIYSVCIWPTFVTMPHSHVYCENWYDHTIISVTDFLYVPPVWIFSKPCWVISKLYVSKYILFRVSSYIHLAISMSSNGHLFNAWCNRVCNYKFDNLWTSLTFLYWVILPVSISAILWY